VGYFTKYGDGGVDFQPLGDLYKTQIINWHVTLKSLPDHPKTTYAGLWLGQTDEKELRMNYATLDMILSGLELKMQTSEIQKRTHVNKEQIERIKKMRRTSQHKRRSPLIRRLGIRTLVLDWRSPVQEG